MDNSKEFQFMLDKAIDDEPLAFKRFDRTKNVQDQLQEMLDGRFSNRYKWVLAEKFSHFCKPSNLGEAIFDMSMEQLWLAFVQYGLYQEKWNSEDWIKDAIGKD